MANLTINGVSAQSTLFSSGTPVDRASECTVILSNIATQSAWMDVYFLTGTGAWDCDTSYNGETVETYSEYSNVGLKGPYTYEKVQEGLSELSGSATTDYGALISMKAIFRNIPDTVNMISVTYYDGDSISDRYYFSFQDPITVDTPNAPTVLFQDGAFTVSWNQCQGNGAEGEVTYRVMYGDSVNGYYAYLTDEISKLSTTIPQWITPEYEEITYSFHVYAQYAGKSAVSESTLYKIGPPAVVWEDRKLSISLSGGIVCVSWNPADIENNINNSRVLYTIVCQITANGRDGSEFIAEDIEQTSFSFKPPAYDQELFMQVTAYAQGVSNAKYSEGVYFTVSSPQSEGIIACYVGDGWKKHVVRCYDGNSWLSCLIYCWDGSNWQYCSLKN